MLIFEYMKLKTRLFISFFILLIVPLLVEVVWYLSATGLGHEPDKAADYIISLLVVLFLTALFLTTWIYRAVVPKMKRLEEAAASIKSGNLDCVIDTSGEDEISDLCRAFEDMRLHLKESTQEKLETEANHSALISNIAHDLRTPLSVIKGYSEGILDGVANTPQKQEQYLKIINKKATEMSSLINELTFYSNIETNRIPYEFEKFSAQAFFEECAEELLGELESEHVSFEYSVLLDDTVQVVLDKTQIMRVIHNLTSNSIKYMRANVCAEIKLRVSDAGDFIQIELEDNGAGISAKDLPYIFDRFYRADESRNSAAGGNGMGLSIADKIISDHGGRIWANSKEGQGTIMTFVLRKYLGEMDV